MSEHDLLAAALAGRYRIERKLGEGAMATVYLAVDLKHDRQVALKVLRPELATSLGPERFLREIQVAARLNHPHIVPLYDSGQAEGFLYFVMPYLSGESLRQKLARERQLPIEAALHITRQIAAGLAYAHAQGLIHRDIKPENILLHEGEALLADFGIALALHAAREERLTETGMSVGTPAYMSPEQASGAPLDARSDVYSLGCVLYELLAGEPPHAGPTAQAVLAKVIAQPPAELRTLRSAVPPPVATAVHRALAKRPVDRFASADAFRAALSSEAGPRRRNIRAFVVTAVVLLIAGAAAVFGWLRVRNAARANANALDPTRIAVLYFDDMSPNRELGYLADGFTEALIHALSQVDRLSVISRNGVKPYRADDVTIDSIVRALSVGTLVEGSVERAGERLRVTVQLIDGSTATHIDSHVVERAGTDVLALRDTIVQEAARLLRQRLGETIRVREQRAEAENTEAWELVQRARQHVDDAHDLYAADLQGALSGFDRADSLLAEAARHAPGWSVPVVMRGDIAIWRWEWLIAQPVNRTHMRTAQQHARRALQLDPQDPAVLTLAGRVATILFHFGDPGASDSLRAGAERDLRAALAIDATRAEAWNALSDLLVLSGRFEEGLQAAERAYAADAFHLEAKEVLDRLCFTSLELELSSARRHCDEARRRFPGEARFAYAQFWVISQETDINQDSIWKLVDEHLRLVPEADRARVRTEDRVIAAGLLAKSGLRARALALIDSVRANETFTPIAHYIEAWARLRLQQPDSALAALRRLLAVVPNQREYLARDRAFMELRADPRFQELVRRQ
jgi:serine/threonine-protein kinase